MKYSLAVFAIVSAAFSCAGVCVKYNGNDPAAKFAVKDLERILEKVEGCVTLKTDLSMPSQEWRLKSESSKALEISGRDGMALAYGIYSFLEEYAGVRWFAYDTEKIPDLAGWTLPIIDVKRRPAILDREMYVASDYMDGYWRLRNKETFRVAFSAGVATGSPFGCHTFAFYAKAVTNDALRALGHNGRIDKNNLCCSKKEVREIVAGQMIEYIKKDRAKKVPAGREYVYPSIYELSQNDGGDNGCKCNACTEFAKRDGSWAGPNIDFVNDVAQRVEKVFPEVTIRTFAYSFTELPPKTVRARKNVQVRFCRSFVFAPLIDGTYNGELLKKWDAFAAQKSVWGYWRQYSGSIFPMVKSRKDIAAEMKFCKARGVVGYFAEAESPLSRSFGLMQDWLFLKLADNPVQNIDKLSNEFLNAYYGKAAPQMEAYLTYLEDRLADVYKRLDMAFISRMNSGDMAQYVVVAEFPDREFFEKADAWFDKAEKVLAEAHDEKSLRHVREERAVVDRTVFDFWPRLEKQGYKANLKDKARRYGDAKKAQAEAFLHTARGKYVDEEREKRLKLLEDEVGFMRNAPLPTPAEFKNAKDVLAYSWNNCGGIPGKVVKDEEAPGLYAYEVPSPGKVEYANFGYYQSALKKWGYELKEKATNGYKLFCLAKDMEMQSPQYVYLNGWGPRVWLPAVGLPLEKRDVWINAKITKDGAMRFDRIFLVKNK